MKRWNDRVAEALAERKVFADLVEGTDAFVQVADLDFRWLAINKAAADEFERIFGAATTGRRFDARRARRLAGAPGGGEAVWRRALSGEEFTAIAEFGDPGRDRRFYEMKFNVLRDAKGELIGAYQFVVDVTERLRDQARLRTIFETSHQLQGLLALDGTLLEANATSLAVIAATADEVVGMPFWETPWFTGNCRIARKDKRPLPASSRQEKPIATKSPSIYLPDDDRSTSRCARSRTSAAKLSPSFPRRLRRQIGAPLKKRCDNRRRWRRSASSPAALRTI